MGQADRQPISSMTRIIIPCKDEISPYNFSGRGIGESWVSAERVIVGLLALGISKKSYTTPSQGRIDRMGHTVDDMGTLIMHEAKRTCMP
ncbi:hypothetical protein MGYG_05930 [Nannizzia gypsea CBS 118893]|uniref:Uncharacterized protein n=1 Tax=Arthroderma gypseum (strain ATCC MYA-4604 / CBS 118893) TaxID=535722 RepID=E4UZZ3_ARTGP|nr:hypothetical protein MGYG_05930 [Nannizzia gypsea CBS 118893]EFR02930.1 hypothetical protein MGYG_05930 [Nannizzia gypsea CBS 118893]